MNKSENKFDTSTLAFTIGTFAQALKVHQRTLRIWDKEGILVSKRTAKNRRYYTVDDLKRGELVLFFTRNLALNISGIKIIFAILDEGNLSESEKLNYIKSMAKKANISEEEQQNNILKISSKGRKPSNNE